MRLNLRTMILATGCLLAIGMSAAQAQTSSLFYYPAPGNYATTRGTVHIPVAGYYYNVPLFAVPAPGNPAPAQGSTYSSFYSAPAQGSTYSSFYSPAPTQEPTSSSFYSPVRSFGYGDTRERYVVPDAPGRAVVRNKYERERPDWLCLRE
jgi:hypothetical protein